MPVTGRTVVVLDPVASGVLAELGRDCDLRVRLQPDPAELPALLAESDVAVVRSGVQLTAAAIGTGGRLRAIVRAGSGTDNIDLAAARRAGVTVCNAPGASARSVAECALALMLALSRKICLADRQLRSGIWDKPGLSGTELAGRTLGVVGLGRIGSRIADLGRALGMRVVGCVERPTPERRTALLGRDIDLAGFADLLAASDVLCLAVPLTERTRGLIGARELALMKPSAHLVNVSRGGVVDEQALHEALRSGGLAGAGIDTPLREGEPSVLAGLDNVVLTPHIGAMTQEAQDRVGAVVVESVRAALDGCPVPYPVA